MRGRQQLAVLTFLALFASLMLVAAPSETLPAFAADPVVFAAIGDYGDSNAGNEQAVANIVDSKGVDLIITTGDNSYGSSVQPPAVTTIDYNVGKSYADYIGSYSGAFGLGGPTNRFFPSPGNHDYSDGAGIAAYKDFFTLPGAGIATSGTSASELYYDFIEGPVHFFAIDSDIVTASPTDPQKVWLEEQLAASTSAWKVVYFHHAAFSSARHGSSAFMQWPFETWGADAVLGGHDHVYERIVRDDNSDGTKMVYLTTGAGGRSLYEFKTPVVGSEVRYNDGYGTVIAEADDNSLTFEFWSVADGGTLIDTYTLGEIGPHGDVTDPVVTIVSPVNAAEFEQGESAVAEYSCSDEGGSGLASCLGDPVNGGPLDTSTIGVYELAVVGVDNDGNSTTVVHDYAVVPAVVPAPVLDVVVVGGSVVVSDAVVAQLGGLVSGSVSRVAGANRYATAAAVSKARFGSGVPSVFVATGEDFPDALAAGAPAGREGSPILLTRQGSLPSETAAELARLKPGRIVVVGGSVVVSDAVVAQLRAFTSGPVVRVAGANRYATAAAVSALMFKPGAAVAYVATGENFPDALAGGPAGVIKGGPILLTRQGSLPSETAAELARLKPAKIVVLGGTVAVSSTVAGQLAAYTTGGVSRFAGANRYATAVAVSQGVFASGANVVFVVTGTNFPDAMAAGPAAGIYGGPILLDAGGLSLPAVTAAEIRRLDQ